ncbi:MAG: peptide chain release factor N(5)-glutamine methyltransferase [Flavobacteriaceae bacterium]|nr:peptide chain release factor N(5)-glutamine methyltransferase [Flavobacteriaceae bacterium]
MTLVKYRNYFFTILKSIIEQNEIEEVFFWIIDHYCGISRMDYILNPDLKLSNHQKENLMNAVSLLKTNMPIQYVLGESEFMSLKFNLNSNVLIPRPETEELVSWVIKDDNHNKTILDIGTGSGCIAIALAKFIKNSRVTAWDIDEKILSVAEKNASKNKVKVLFELKDITTIKSNNKFDLIISNPPYICDSEKLGMQNNVLLFEPHLALFVNDNDPLFFYLKIIDFAKSNLNDNGKIFLEINENQSIGVIKLLNNAGFYDIELKKDFRLKNRMIKASFK